MRIFPRSLFSITALGTILAILAAAQQTPSPSPANRQSPVQEKPPVLKVTTRLVLVDVVALDRKGVPVTDLKSEDFTLMEEDREQKIRSFSYHDSGTQGTTMAADSAAVTEPAKLPPNHFTNVPRYNTSRALNIILLDGLNTRLTNHN